MSSETKLTFLNHRSAVCLVPKSKVYDQKNPFNPPRSNWKYWLVERRKKNQSILADNVIPLVYRLKLDDHPTYASKSTKTAQSPDLNLTKTLLWDLKKAVATRKPKIISDLEAFCMWVMGSDSSKEVTEASKNLEAMFGGYKV